MALEEGFAPDFDGATASLVQLSIPGASSTPAWLTFNIVDEVSTDTMQRTAGPATTPLGPTVDDLVAALRTMKGYQAGPVTDITVGGLPAKSFELVDSADNVCEPGDDELGGQ